MNNIFSRPEWPICLEDIECDEVPPSIPTNPEYVLEKDDGTVEVERYIYPLPTNHISEIFTSEHNNSLLPRNYKTKLVYKCGSARHFKSGPGLTFPDDFQELQKMTCQWDRQWTSTHIPLECEWIECLRPPEPPAESNLRLTDWFGETVPFGGSARYVCKRGMQFEEDPAQLDVLYQCQDGSDGITPRGFFNVPDTPSGWPRCLEAPLCPTPPEVPLEGVRDFKTKVVERQASEACGVDGEPIDIQCHSFLSIYIRTAYFGRYRANVRNLCNGKMGTDSGTAPLADCIEHGVNKTLRDNCHGEFNCTTIVPSDAFDLGQDCEGKRREVNFTYICVACLPWNEIIESQTCITDILIHTGWFTPAFLSNITIDDQKTMLRVQLSKSLDPTVHSMVDLSIRELVGPLGSLCGLGALYLALENTFLSRTEMTLQSYYTMRELIFKELEIKKDDELEDTLLLENYFNMVCNGKTRYKRDSGLGPVSSIMRVKRQAAESEEDIAMRSYGAILRYECGPARKFMDPFTKVLYTEQTMQCNWNQTWTPVDTIDPCVWTACLNPPQPPTNTLLKSNWDGLPITFNSTTGYSCMSDDLFFEIDRDLTSWNLTCYSNGSVTEPPSWPNCLPSVNCSEPPMKPEAGTWEWDQGYEYGNQILYTCGPYGKFFPEEGDPFKELIVECGWNKTWAPSLLPRCGSTACQDIPFPPRSVGMEYSPDAKNNMTLVSDYTIYNPRLPFSMNFPGPQQCDGEQKLMIVGQISSSMRKFPEIILHGTASGDESFHILLDVEQKYIQRWSVLQGVEQLMEGKPFEGTTIDFDEPIILTLRCDDDGWSLQVNAELAYEHYLHIIPTTNVTRLEIKGDIQTSFVGFGSSELEPAAPVGFNLTYICPDGWVFDHDWFATPFVMLTCQESGVFDKPAWDDFQCVLPTTTECFDCTTTSK